MQAQAYSTATVLDKLPPRLAPLPFVHDLARRLARVPTRDPHGPRHPGAARRRSMEHQLDDHLALIDACRGAGVLLAIGRDGRRRESATPRRAARASAAILPAQTIHPWELLHGAPADAGPGLRGLQFQAKQLLAWLTENQPERVRWTLPQSQPRARRDEDATRHFLPRAARKHFYAWRAAVRWFVALLLTLHQWWTVLCPARRAPAPTPKAERPERAVSPETQDGTRYRAQSAQSVRALLNQVWPRKAM